MTSTASTTSVVSMTFIKKNFILRNKCILLFIAWKRPLKDQILRKTSPKGFSASKCNVGKWIFSKLGTFWEKISGVLQDFFWFFIDFVLKEYFRRIFLQSVFLEFFGRIFLFTSLKSDMVFESERDWCFCQDFVSMQKEVEF